MAKARTFIYPADSQARTDAEGPIWDGVKSMLDQLMSADIISGYGIDIHDSNLTGLDSSSSSSFRTSFREWRNNNPTYGHRTGVHIGVSSSYDFATADKCDSSGTTGFVTHAQATIGTAGSADKYENFAAQEPLHTLIRYDIAVDLTMNGDSLVRSGDHMHEHDLGKELAGGSYQGPLSPLATLYQDTHADHGECISSGGWDDTWSTTLTKCTKKAVRETKNNEV